MSPYRGEQDPQKRIYCFFMDFQKPFETIPWAKLMQELEAKGVPVDMEYEIYALWIRERKSALSQCGEHNLRE
mgnify:CR=1 FL=1